MMRLRRPSWLAIALTVVGVLVFVRLGMWQLHRASYKEDLLRRFAAAASAPLQRFDAVAGHAPSYRYPHVSVRGRFVPDRVYYLDDQIHGGRLGVQVYMPFRPDDHARLLLVDMGFLQREGGRETSQPHLPPVPTGEVTLHGVYAPPPGAGFKLGGNALPRQHRYPKTVIYVDMRDIGADLGATLYPGRLLLDPDPSTTYVRQWTPGFMPPARHRGYAFQWFSFALAAVAIFVIMHRRRPDDGDDGDERA
jgi:surfeit locus 1 family protein